MYALWTTFAQAPKAEDVELVAPSPWPMKGHGPWRDVMAELAMMSNAPFPAPGHRIRGPVAGLFLARHALSPVDAIDYAPVGRIARFWFDRHVRDGAIRRTSDGRWWFDLAAHYAAAEARSRRAVPIALVVSVLIAAVAMVFYRG